jgi:SAM-dependent methyltransferase
VTFHAPEAYERFVGRYGSALAAELIAFAGVAAPMRALDVGCGTGALTTPLAGLLGPGNVAGADPSEPFAEACRARVPGAEIVVAAAEDLPFPSATFDAALSQLVVNFMQDAHAGVGEMARVTRPGGVLAACVWDYAGEMTMLRAYWDAAYDIAPELAPAVDEGVVMPWCREGELESLWRDTGLENVRSDALVVRASYDGFDDLWSPIPTGIAPAGAFYASLDEERRDALREAFRARLGVDERPFELTARAWAVAGVR